MPVEQRVVGGAKIGGPKIGGAKIGSAAPEPEPEPAKKSKKKLLLVVVLVVVLAGAAAWWFLLRPSGATGAPAEPPAPKKGAIIAVEPISLNLTDGHYLRLGFSLQLTADADPTMDTAQATDTAITVFSGRTVAEVSDPATREELRTQLSDELADVYEGEVMGVYLTDYVTQ